MFYIVLLAILDSDETIDWDNVNFQTHCWFLTLHAHHLAIMPAIQRYTKRLRAIKEVNRMISELNATKAQWENSPYAARNKQMYIRWTQQIKKLNRLDIAAHVFLDLLLTPNQNARFFLGFRSKACCDIGLIDPNLLRQCMNFYSTVCEFILYRMEDRKAQGPFIKTISPQLLIPSSAFSALPEWYVEDIADFLLFAMQ